MTVSDPFAVTQHVHRGACAVCGFETILTWRGTPGPHFEARVYGRDADGSPRLHAGVKRCVGGNQPAEPLEQDRPEVPARYCASLRCGKRFTPNDPKKRYCSDTCRYAADRDRQSGGAA